MLGQMILAYEYHMGQFSGPRIFCRMDVSIFMIRHQNKVHYFLHEFDHCNNTGLYSFVDT